MRNVDTHAEITLAARHQAFLAAATADNTRRAYRSAVRHFLAWGGVLPCDEGTTIRYLLAFADSHNPRTLAVRLTALAQWHHQQGFPDPTSTPTVRKTLAGIARLHGKPKRKARALPVEDLERIASHLAGLRTLRAGRDIALLQIGFFGGFRRSELVSLEVSHVAWEKDGIVLTLPRSKTDQEGRGISKAIPYGAGVCCPATALRTWLDVAGIADGPLFRAITKWDEVQARALNPASVNAILESCARAAGLESVPELSSHSLRRGMATSAYRAGASPRDIKRQGGWRHDGTVQGYIEEAGQFEENAMNALLRRK
ncbi:site-specific integrase [Noviherbaspirillum sp. 17J57-3]|uniref:Site-specific integrase n=2 Tax=Noviherbaspirillum galbum TaxID=2709383 RepID=A0A6B3SV25_9BURK|nr:site-specific integrase [Noviherbaspirillum galbum]